MKRLSSDAQVKMAVYCEELLKIEQWMERRDTAQQW